MLDGKVLSAFSSSLCSSFVQSLSSFFGCFCFDLFVCDVVVSFGELFVLFVVVVVVSSESC